MIARNFIEVNDLFGVDHIFRNNLADLDLCLAIFQKYCAHDETPISGKLFHKNMVLKKAHKDFKTDMIKLLPATVSWNFDDAFEFVQSSIITKIP